MLRHDVSVLPVDSSVAAHARDALGLPAGDPRAIEAHVARWGAFRFLGYRLGKIAARRAAGEEWAAW